MARDLESDRDQNFALHTVISALLDPFGALIRELKNGHDRDGT